MRIKVFVGINVFIITMFNGVRVLDLTHVYSGPLATRYLADYGAEVIKIEHPQLPDESRSYPPLRNNWSGYYEILNRGKHCITLNLKQPEDLLCFYKLCKTADVVVENMSPSKKHSLSISYDDVINYNPHIIYASLSGNSEIDDKRYYDTTIQAESGLMSLSGDGTNPVKIGPSVVDAFSGINLAFAIGGALYQREKTGKGQNLFVSMLGSTMNLLESNLIETSITGTNSQPPGNQDNAIAPFGLFTTQDGFIVIAAGNDILWRKLVVVLKQFCQFDETLYSTNSLRLHNLSNLVELMNRVCITKTTNEWNNLFEEYGIPASPVHTMKDVLVQKDLFANGYLVKQIHPKLGDCVIPGKSIKSSLDTPLEYSTSESVGESNNKYGIHPTSTKPTTG